MKKTNTPKTTVRKPKKAVDSTPLKITPVVCEKRCFNPWSLSIYVYWFIILFFIASTFYILGRSHDTLSHKASNVEITEEALMQAGDYYEQGKTKLLAGDTAAAIDDLTTAIETGAADVDAYLLRGEAYMQSGDYKNAMADFDLVIERDSGNAVAYYDRALLNTRVENYDKALNDINAALAAQAEKPSNILQLRDLYAKRGQLNLWLKNWDGAIADYTNSLSHTSGGVSPNVYAERAEAYTAVGNYADAINDYGSAVRVISEQIQGATTAEARESLSSNAMSYFEKSAALNLQVGNIDAARNDLSSAYTIAGALKDTASVERLGGLMANLPTETPTAPADEPVAEPVTEPVPGPVTPAAPETPVE